VEHQGTDTLVAELVRYLVMQGVPVVGVEPERSELERIFLEVTKGDLQ
jgi:ABC-2 type transport system ATP-binding protein